MDYYPGDLRSVENPAKNTGSLIRKQFLCCSRGIMRMNKNRKQSESMCSDCEHLDSKVGRCKKYHCPLPVNIDLEFLRGIPCIEDWRCKNESTSKT